jgi:ectoine hydroxylase-related dioxygenase (phytanoyl-CoA dioxygenase family)
MSSINSFFHENGYYHAKGVFSAGEIHDLEIDFDRMVAQLKGSGEDINARWKGAAMDRLGVQDTFVVHTHNVQKYSARWLRAFLHPRFLEVCVAIHGEDVVLHHSKLFQKPAEKGAPFPLHQDWSYFPSVRDTMMAGVIHVTNATDEMGCLRVVPGSHKLGRLGDSNGQNDSSFDERFPMDSSIPVEAEPGDVVFFHYLTLHGSKPNRSSKTRKTVLVQTLAGNDRIEEGNTHSNERLVLAGWNYSATRTLAGQA